MEEKLAKFLDNQASGKIPCGQQFYLLDDSPIQDGGGGGPSVKLVTPTEQTVAQAKSELKDNIMKRVVMQQRPMTSRKRKKPVKRMQQKKRGDARRRRSKQQRGGKRRGKVNRRKAPAARGRKRKRTATSRR